MNIQLKGYTGIVSEESGIFTGTITDSDGRVVWVDGCDVEHEMQTWVLGAFQEFVKTGIMPELYYGD